MGFVKYIPCDQKVIQQTEKDKSSLQPLPLSSDSRPLKNEHFLGRKTLAADPAVQPFQQPTKFAPGLVLLDKRTS